mmetsp:Transcript_2967/g.8187  ORF Transcript_2967/g.8187 Transcript_2967/m.8187 type:complete len:879 (-) Transcript_2967:23-2659(-)
MVDYSKWDKLAVSSSSEDDDPAAVSTLEDYSRESCFCEECAGGAQASPKMPPPPPPPNGVALADPLSEKLTMHTEEIGDNDNSGGTFASSGCRPEWEEQQEPAVVFSAHTKSLSGVDESREKVIEVSDPALWPTSSHGVIQNSSAPSKSARRMSPTHTTISGGAEIEKCNHIGSAELQGSSTALGGVPKGASTAMLTRVSSPSASASLTQTTKGSKRTVPSNGIASGGPGVHASQSGATATAARQKAVDDKLVSASAAASVAAAAFSAFSSSLTTQRAAQPADIFGPPPTTRKHSHHHGHNHPTPSPQANTPTFAAPPQPSTLSSASAGGHTRGGKSSATSLHTHGNGDAIALTGRHTKFVQLVENDDGEGLPEVFLGHPSEHVPRVDSVDGRMHGWGIAVSRDHHHDFARKMRQMKAHAMYNSRTGVLLPELQFVRELIVRKKREIVAARLSPQVHALARSDYVLRVSICDVVPELFRVVKVSGGTSLFALQDKVLSPVMGWTRNVHAYVFISQQDGAVYGPQDASFEDLSRMDSYGWESIDDTRVRLCDVLAAPHHAMHYVYDLEEGWWHRITVQEIRVPAESTGEVVVLEGAMACPPEEALGIGLVGAKGSLGFATALASGAIDCMEAGQAWNVHREVFDPYDFSLEEVDARLSEALAAPASVQYGSKRIFYRDEQEEPAAHASSDVAGDSGAADALGEHSHVVRDSALAHSSDTDLYEGWEPQVLGRRKGHYLWTGPLWKCTASGDGCGCRGSSVAGACHGPMVSEVLSKTRDPKRIALCNWCGNPNDLSVCGGCRRVRYCSRDCQEDSWRAGHRFHCDVDFSAYSVKEGSGLSSDASAANRTVLARSLDGVQETSSLPTATLANGPTHHNRSD